jgi:hypothetical protein
MRHFALAGFALAVATSAQAMPRATPGQADSLIIQVRQGCGIGMVLVDGQCVSRHDLRVERRVERRTDDGAYGTGAYTGNYYGAYAPGQDIGNYHATHRTSSNTGNDCYRAWDQDARNNKSMPCSNGPAAYVDTPGVNAIMRARDSWGNGTWYAYATRSGITCMPGTTIMMGGQPYLCQ